MLGLPSLELWPLSEEDGCLGKGQRETGKGEELKEKDLRGRERKEWQREYAIWRELSAEECGGGRKRTVSYGFCIEYMS